MSLENMEIQQSLDNLMTCPFVSYAVAGGWVSIAEGNFRLLDWNSGTFGDVPSSPEGRVKQEAVLVRE
ncbi:MAG: hypothetical protein ACI9XZ_004635 [Alphaproteobacteria bacterium]|jgi:hypothetical protein